MNELEARFVCEDCGSLNITELLDDDEDVLEWLADLRKITGWEERGKPNEHLLWRNDWPGTLDEEEIAVAVESFASVQKKTLEGYPNMVAAFKKHIRLGYHKPQSERIAAPQRSTSRASGGRY